MQSKQTKSEHAQNSGEDSGLHKENPSALTILNSIVTDVESFKLLGSTISKDLKSEFYIDCIVKKAQQRLYFLH